MPIERSLAFLRELDANNSLEWMHSNKATHLAAKAEFAAFVQELIEGIAPFDSAVAGLRAEDLIFRLNRDTRFSKDKSPYRTAFARTSRPPVARRFQPATICI